MLSTLTPEGVQTIKNNPQRIREVNKEIEQLGARSRRSGRCSGRFDFVNIVEAPDERPWRASRWSWARAAPPATSR